MKNSTDRPEMDLYAVTSLKLAERVRWNDRGWVCVERTPEGPMCGDPVTHVLRFLEGEARSVKVTCEHHAKELAGNYRFQARPDDPFATAARREELCPLTACEPVKPKPAPDHVPWIPASVAARNGSQSDVWSVAR